MLHTLHSLSRLQDNADLVLDQQHYAIFDSRYFISDKNIEDTFNSITESFCKVWLTNIKSFIDAIVNNHNIYKVEAARNFTLIPEEAIYLNLQGLDISNISYFYTTKGLRLIGIDSKDENDNNSLSIFDSPVYDPLHKEFYSAITIVLYKNLLQECKSNEDVLNRVLLRIANIVAITYIDNQLMTKYNVPVNRILAANSMDSNKDVIILPESFNLSDTRFLFGYFYCLFSILTSILNSDILSVFTDYSSVISLPDIFSFNMTDEEAERAESKMSTLSQEDANFYALGFKQKIYARIWNYAKKYGKSQIPDKDYIEICADILRNLEVNIDKTYYEAMDDSMNYYNEEEEQESTEEEE